MPILDHQFLDATGLDFYSGKIKEYYRIKKGSGKNSIAQFTGNDNTTSNSANGENAVAFGKGTTANDFCAFTEGYSTFAGERAHAEGNGTKANSAGAHAEGYLTTAENTGSHSEGGRTTSLGSYSHAEGESSNVAMTEGGVTTSDSNDTIISKWNTTKFLLSKGNGSHAEGKHTLALGNDSHTEGFETKAISLASHAEGKNTTAQGEASHAEGAGNTASGTNAHVEGYGNIASGDKSHAEGLGTVAVGSYSHAEGNGSYASGSAAHAEGTSSVATGAESHVEGYHNQAIGEASHAEGSTNIAYGGVSHVEGNHTQTFSDFGHTEGIYTKAGYYSHAEGYGYFSNNKMHYTIAGSARLRIVDNAGGSNSVIIQDNYVIPDTWTAGTQISFDTTKGNRKMNLAEIASISGQTITFKEVLPVLLEDTYSGLFNAEDLNDILEAWENSSNSNKVKPTSSGPSHAEGVATESIGYGSHAEGVLTKAYTNGAHSEGQATTAEGFRSHAEGLQTYALATQSHAEGDKSTAGAGCWRILTSSIANGVTTLTINTDDFTHVPLPDDHVFPSNPMENDYYRRYVYAIYWEQENAGSSPHHHYIIHSQPASSNYIFIDSVNGTSITLNKPISFENIILDSGIYKTAYLLCVGTAAYKYKNSQWSYNSFESGFLHGPYKFGNCMHAEGYDTFALSNYSHTEGNYTEAIGDSSHAGGSNSIAAGFGSFAHGNYTQAYGSGAISLGSRNIATPAASFVCGHQNATGLGVWRIKQFYNSSMGTAATNSLMIKLNEQDKNNGLQFQTGDNLYIIAQECVVEPSGSTYVCIPGSIIFYKYKAEDGKYLLLEDPKLGQSIIQVSRPKDWPQNGGNFVPGYTYEENKDNIGSGEGQVHAEHILWNYAYVVKIGYYDYNNNNTEFNFLNSNGPHIISFGNASVVGGINNLSFHGSSLVTGYRNMGYGDQSCVINSQNTALGIGSFAGGNESVSHSNYSFAYGKNIEALKSRQFAIGAFNNLAFDNMKIGDNGAVDAIFVIGNGSNQSKRHTAFAIKGFNGDLNKTEMWFNEKGILGVGSGDTIVAYKSNGNYVQWDKIIDAGSQATCFRADTSYITMYDGTKKLISEIKKGDSVLGYDVNTNTFCEVIVLANLWTGTETDFKTYVTSNGTTVDIYGSEVFATREIGNNQIAIHSDKNLITTYNKTGTAPSLIMEENPTDTSVKFIDAITYKCNEPTRRYRLYTSNGTFFVNGILRAGYSREVVNLFEEQVLKPTEELAVALEQIKAIRSNYDDALPNTTVEDPEHIDEFATYTAALGLISANKEYLANTDYKALKYAEGALSEEEWIPIRDARAAARAQINTQEEVVTIYKAKVQEHNPHLIPKTRQQNTDDWHEVETILNNNLENFRVWAEYVPEPIEPEDDNFEPSPDGEEESEVIIDEQE